MIVIPFDTKCFIRLSVTGLCHPRTATVVYLTFVAKMSGDDVSVPTEPRDIATRLYAWI